MGRTNPVDRIADDVILQAFPIRDLAQRPRWYNVGYRVPGAPGRAAVLIRGREVHMLDRAKMTITGEDLGSYAAYIRVGRMEVPVALTAQDAIHTSDGYPCTGRVDLEVSMPDADDSLKAFALAYAAERVVTLSAVGERLRPALASCFRREMAAVPYEKALAGLDRVCEGLAAEPGEGVRRELASLGLDAGRTARHTLRPGAFSVADQEAFEQFRAQVASLGERQDPASQLISAVMTLAHNPAPAFRVNMYLSKLRDRAPTRGGIGVGYGDPTYKQGEVYARGEAISLDVTCSQDACLYLLDVDSAGELTLLFPNEGQMENEIPGGRTLRLPDDLPALFGGEGRPWAILPDATPGEEYLKVIATSRPVDLLPSAVVENRRPLLYCRSASDALPDVLAMADRLRALDPSEWSDCACQFLVR